MSKPNPIPSGSDLYAKWSASYPGSLPSLPDSWTATVLLSPFGDSNAPLKNYSQLVVGTIEYFRTASDKWMRARLYLTQDQTYFDFVFVNFADTGQGEKYQWFWIHSMPGGPATEISGPFETTLLIPEPTFFPDKPRWANTYPLMCTDTNPQGIASNHWVVPSPGSVDHGSWYSFRRDTGTLFRIFMMDSTNPWMMPILGSYYIANLPTLTAGPISQSTTDVIQQIRTGVVTAKAEYWNPMVTQQDIQRAMAYPIASATCTPKDIQAILPGFSAMPSGIPLPRWTDSTYIEGWTLATDLIPYYTRVCYLWTGKEDSKQQTVFIGLGPVAGLGSYLQRTDTCLNLFGTMEPYYDWRGSTDSWAFDKCLDPLPVGIPYPDWLERDKGVVMAQIVGNANFGLNPGQALNLIAAPLPRRGGELALFWLWFLENGTGMLFTEGNYINPTSHKFQLIDYNSFVRNATIAQDDFTCPCGWTTKRLGKIETASGHLTRVR